MIRLFYKIKVKNIRGKERKKEKKSGNYSWGGGGNFVGPGC